MLKKIDHIAIVVKNIEEALIPYREILGLKATEIEYVESFNVRIAFLPIGDTKIELVQPLSKEGELIDFLEDTGGGLHHIAFEVEGIENVIKEVSSKKIKMKDRTPRPGAHNTKVAFAEKEEFAGVIVEFVEPN